MLSSGKCLFTVIMVALVSQLRLAVEDKSVKTSITKDNQFKSYANTHKDKILAALDVIATTEDFYLTTFLSVNDKGVNVIANRKGKEFIARIIIGDEGLTALNEETDLHELHLKGVDYINKIDTSVNKVGKVGDIEFIFCILMFEEHDAWITSSVLFKPKEHNNKEYFTQRLFRFFGRLVYAFVKLNFKKSILHGNVSPKTIFVRYGQNNEIYPVISDFTLMLENTSKQDLESKVVRYEGDYRSPELQKSITNSAASNPFSHNYSGDFLEDVYAIGHLIEETLASHKPHLDANRCEYKLLQENAKIMKREKDKTSDFRSIDGDLKSEIYRSNMRLVLADFVEDIMRCDQYYKDIPNLSFVDDAKNLLLTFYEKLPFI